ncbi:hypothetical protein LNP74_22075 [Klebsiella pneumoniae subsp. pneumoniae]|nr:hypothetical protein [Klebsiella pneumoniae subsp. pneumoniae]
MRYASASVGEGERRFSPTRSLADLRSSSRYRGGQSCPIRVGVNSSWRSRQTAFPKVALIGPGAIGTTTSPPPCLRGEGAGWSAGVPPIGAGAAHRTR